MLSLKDCLDFCDLEFPGVEALSDYHGIPIIIAAQLGNELLKTPDGIVALQYMMLDRLEQAMIEGDTEKQACIRVACQNLQEYACLSPPEETDYDEESALEA